jgi:signal peptidase I
VPQEERAVSVAPLALGAFGAVLTLVGVGLGIAGFMAGRRTGYGYGYGS